MQLLTVAASLYRFHHDILGRHKWQLLHNAAMYHTVVHHHSGSNVDINIEYRINAQKRLRDRNTAVGTVVERTFKPLGRRRYRRIERIVYNIPCQRRHTLAPHRIALVRHRG